MFLGLKANSNVCASFRAQQHNTAGNGPNGHINSANSGHITLQDLKMTSPARHASPRDEYTPTTPRSHSDRRSSLRQSLSQNDPLDRLTEIAAPGPVQNPNEGSLVMDGFLDGKIEVERDQKNNWTGSSPHAEGSTHRYSAGGEAIVGSPAPDQEYNAPPGFANVTDISPILVTEDINEAGFYRHRSLEDAQHNQHVLRGTNDPQRQPRAPAQDIPTGLTSEEEKAREVPRVLTELTTVSYLVVFAILGTLARLGLTALTVYAGSPVTFAVLWSNFGGTLIQGFVSEGAWLFGHPSPKRSISRQETIEEAGGRIQRGVTGSSPPDESDNSQSAEKSQPAAPARPAVPVPFYIGIATGFCGSFMSFSSFMEDCLLAMSNAISVPAYHHGDGGAAAPLASRNAGKDLMAVLAVIIVGVSASLAALKMGAHLAIFLRGLSGNQAVVPPRLYYVLDRLAIFLGIGMWAGAVVMTALPPDRPGGISAGEHETWKTESWREEVLFALVFAPLGCLLRFYLSIKINSLVVGFPLGTFVANIFGTLVFCMAFVLQREPLGSASDLAAAVGGGQIGCQVLQGVLDGFCGCLTTVSTWAMELTTLRRRHSYVYGLVTLGVGLVCTTLIMGMTKWTIGWAQLQC